MIYNPFHETVSTVRTPNAIKLLWSKLISRRLFKKKYHYSRYVTLGGLRIDTVFSHNYNAYASAKINLPTND